MNDIEALGKLIEVFIKKMTSPEIGQFRLEVSTFRIILERARVGDPTLVKFTLTENGKIINNMNDDRDSVEALITFLQRSMDFISSLIGEELARDIISSSMRSEVRTIAPEMMGKDEMLGMLPEPFVSLIKDAMEKEKGNSDHVEVLDLFQEVFQAYLKDLSVHTDLSAFKLKLSILRENHRLLKYVDLTKDNELRIDNDKWSSGSRDEVKDSLVALFNSMVGLSTFLLGKEEAMKKATRIFQYYFDGKDGLLEKYGMLDVILDGALHRKVSTGIDILDRRMAGGIPKGASILIISPSGIERDIFISGILNRGLNNGSSALLVLSKEPPRSIRMLLRSNNLDPEELEENGRLRIVDWFSWRGERIIGVEREGYALKSSKILSNLGIAINKGLRELSYSTNKLGIVHIIGPATNIFEFNQVYNFIQRLRAKFKDDEMASIFLLETDSLSKEMETRILEVFDGTLIMNKRMEKGKFTREILIKSLEGVDFDANPISFIIKDNMIIPESSDMHETGPIDTSDDGWIPSVQVKEDGLVDSTFVIDLDDEGSYEKESPVAVGEVKEEGKEKPTKGKPRVIRKRKISKEKAIYMAPPKMVKGITPEEETIIAPKQRGTIYDGINKVEDASKERTPKEGDGAPVKKKVRRKRITIKGPRAASGGKIEDIEGMDLGLDGDSPEEVLKDAIDTIDQLLNIDDDVLTVSLSRNNSRKKVK